MNGHGAPIDERRIALRAKYLAERDKRLRPDGAAQYVKPTGRLADLNRDPYTERGGRAPLTDHVTFLMVGGGFAGLTACARLREAGIHDIRVIEAGGDFGGAWYWNRYPGAMCDTTALIYLPLLEETGYMPSMKYASAPEIWDHAIRIAKQYGLYENAVFSTSVRMITWQDDSSLWLIETDRGDKFTAKYVAMGTGPFNRPKLPGIPGFETFRGHLFHTARWDYDYTGGNYRGDRMTKLTEKRVGVIGTGATAVQCVPALGRDAKELYVFQRTPSSIAERNNARIDPAWFKTLRPGWQRMWMQNFATLQTGGYADEDFVADGWTDIARRVRDRIVELQHAKTTVDADVLLALNEDCDDERMDEIRGRVDQIVIDPTIAEGLKPWYRQSCKRPCFHDEYLQTFNLPNAHLVDTDGAGVQRIDATGLWAKGSHYRLDCIVLASGFDFNDDYTERSGFECVGRQGLKLSDKWSDGIESFQGMHISGFPNLFVIGIPQSPSLGANVPTIYHEAALNLSAVVNHCESIGAQEVECTATAEQDWVDAILGGQSTLGGTECTPGYYNNEGKSDERRHRLNMGRYPLSPAKYFSYIEEWRSGGKFSGLQFRLCDSPGPEDRSKCESNLS